MLRGIRNVLLSNTQFRTALLVGAVILGLLTIYVA